MLVEVCESVCKKCVHSVSLPTCATIFCNYVCDEGHTRLYKDGKKYYADGMCDKFKEGKAKRGGRIKDSMKYTTGAKWYKESGR